MSSQPSSTASLAPGRDAPKKSSARKLIIACKLKAIRTALIPTIIVMSTAGFITMPGIITRQLPASMDLIGATKYQISQIFLIPSGNRSGGFAAIYIAKCRLVNHRDRVRLNQPNRRAI